MLKEATLVPGEERQKKGRIYRNGKEKNQPKVKLTATESWFKYNLMTWSKGNREFFPNYKEEFMITYGNNEIIANVTSCKKGCTLPDSKKGNYIKSIGKPSFNDLYEKMNLKEGDEVYVTETTPKTNYKLSKK